jgi:hypothetical protein
MSIRMPRSGRQGPLFVTLVTAIAAMLVSACAVTSLESASDEQPDGDVRTTEQGVVRAPAPPPPCMFMECDFEGCRIFEAPCPPDPVDPPSDQ